jgi:sec-independent protein translocase protein TatB
MSGVSSAELLLLLVIGLIVLGPKRLPEIANKIGGWVGQARRMTRVMKRQLEEELNVDEFSKIGKPDDAPV